MLSSAARRLILRRPQLSRRWRCPLRREIVGQTTVQACRATRTVCSGTNQTLNQSRLLLATIYWQWTFKIYQKVVQIESRPAAAKTKDSSFSYGMAFAIGLLTVSCYHKGNASSTEEATWRVDALKCQRYWRVTSSITFNHSCCTHTQAWSKTLLSRTDCISELMRHT